MKSPRCPACALALLSGLIATPAVAQKFTPLGEVASSPGLNVVNVGVSADGSVVVGNTSGINDVNQEAFRWSAGTLARLGFLRSDLKRSSAIGASADGSIIVGSSENGGPDLGGFPSSGGVLWQNGTITELERPVGLTAGSINGISDDGSTVIATAVRYDPFQGYERQVYFYADGVIAPVAMPAGLPYGYAIDISPDGSSAVGGTSVGFAEPQTGWIYNGATSVLAEPTGYRQAIPAAMSNAVVVGSGILEQDNTYRPVIWTAPGSPTVLPVPGAQGGRALGVSDDGLVVVGHSINSFTAGDHEAYVWNLEEGTTPRRLLEILEDLGEDMSGWTLHSASGVSGDGGIIVGYASDSTGLVQAFRADVGRSFMRFTSPAANEIVEPGMPYEVRFTTEQGATEADIYFVGTTDPNGPRALVASNVPIAGGSWTWDVPPRLGSPSSFLIAVNVDDSTQEARTSRFRVREKWRIHRVVGTVAQPQYDPITDAHIWSFDQSDESAWPPEYWNQPTNAYQDLENGYDPFVQPFQQVRYDLEYFGGKEPDDHPTWTSWVDAFGFEASYVSTTAVDYDDLLLNPVNTDGVAMWDMATGQNFLEAGAGYAGVCYGLSLAVLAAFGDESNFRARWIPGREGESIASMSPDDDILRAVHALYNYQFSVEQLTARLRNTQNGITPRIVLEQIKRMFERDVRDLDRFLIFFSEYDDGGEVGFGGHAVVPLRMTRTEDDLHVIDIYDPNYGNELAQLVVDSTNNSWSHSDPNWFGGTGSGLYLSIDATRALTSASPPWAIVFSDGDTPMLSSVAASGPVGGSKSGRANEEGTQRVFVSGGDSGVHTAEGEVSHRGRTLTETLPNAYAEFPITGRPSRPFAYNVPPTDLTVGLSAGYDGHSSIRIQSSRNALHFSRAWFEAGVTDSVMFTGGFGSGAPAALTVLPGDSGYVSLGALATVGSGPTLSLRSMSVINMLTGPSSRTTVGLVDDSTAITVAAAEATAYNLSIGQTGAGVPRRFYHNQVTLDAGATHTIRPDWAGALDSVSVDVDHDGDGSIDETLILVGQGLPVAIDEIGRSQGDDGNIVVEVYPNPTRASATLRVSRPLVPFEGWADGRIRVGVFDVLGRRLSNVRVEAAGRDVIEYTLNLGNLPTGTYFVRVQSGRREFVVRQLLVIR